MMVHLQTENLAGSHFLGQMEKQMEMDQEPLRVSVQAEMKQGHAGHITSFPACNRRRGGPAGDNKGTQATLPSFLTCDRRQQSRLAREAARVGVTNSSASTELAWPTAKATSCRGDQA
ncbi:hypothetical protein B296_00052345 [Ensete ventricosum]|uniref:Uncharacterized protein n=1 Tax=Ensete ventricosum TaxID=4639 RepID=A0A426YCS0_ENSVE|nr:hypothetical protein B296_00052345 [Ensete ventricosum]